MKKLFSSLFKSFTNDPGGPSAKKLTIFAISLSSFCAPMLVWTYWAYKHNDWSLFPALLAIVSGTVLGLFAANVWDKSKNPNPPVDPEKKD